MNKPAFKTGNTQGRGRPKGAKNKKGAFSAKLTSEAIAKLETAVLQGEQWAIVEVLKRTNAPLKAVTPEDSIDAEFLRLKMKELHEFEERLKALEASQ